MDLEVIRLLAPEGTPALRTVAAFRKAAIPASSLEWAAGEAWAAPAAPPAAA
jgi:hypothetical protein